MGTFASAIRDTAEISPTHVGTAALGCPAAQVHRAAAVPGRCSHSRDFVSSIRACHPEEGALCPTKDLCNLLPPPRPTAEISPTHVGTAALGCPAAQFHRAAAVPGRCSHSRAVIPTRALLARRGTRTPAKEKRRWTFSRSKSVSPRSASAPTGPASTGSQNLRNDIEHYYTKANKKALEGVISNAFVVARNFIATELKEDPLKLLGDETWQAAGGF